ncbi:MAG: hypothetical protein ABH885_00460, partial [Candidatus Omnitrophota bacterium]
MTGHKKRKNYFVEKKFQASFFLKFALLLILESALIATMFIYVSRGTLTAAYCGSEFTIEKTCSYFMIDFIFMTLIVGAI